jgi:hypothetical protein
MIQPTRIWPRRPEIGSPCLAEFNTYFGFRERNQAPFQQWKTSILPTSKRNPALGRFLADLARTKLAVHFPLLPALRKN